MQNRRVRIAVYAISKNEEQFVERFCEAAKDADLISISDTGSTDGTVEKARQCGAVVNHICITPWRFDHARNAALALIPTDADYCIIADMDEVLQPGWREELQKAYDAKDEKGLPRPKHKLVTDYDLQGKPAVEFYANRIHTRDNYRWRYPIHEVITHYPVTTDERYFEIGLELHHHQDQTKSRKQYLDMLEMAVDEDPDNARMLYYYARELFYNQNKEHFIYGSSVDLDTINKAKQFGEFDAVFIDGNHSYEYVKLDWQNYSPLVKKGGIVSFHDACLDAERYGTPKVLKEIGNEISLIRYSKEVGIAYYIKD